MLSKNEVPVAYSMIEFVNSQEENKQIDVIQRFMCYWVAFNNIYSIITEYKGQTATLKHLADGSVALKSNGSVNIPVAENWPSEQKELKNVFEEFSSELKKALIMHPSVKFFLQRVPVWKGKHVKTDIRGQRINGVIDLQKTVDPGNPVWHPIDIIAYERYIQGKPNPDDEDRLAGQVLDMIYGVRNNTFHGGKQADAENDIEVVRNATSLLEIILNYFIDIQIVG